MTGFLAAVALVTVAIVAEIEILTWRAKKRGQGSLRPAYLLLAVMAGITGYTALNIALRLPELPPTPGIHQSAIHEACTYTISPP